MIPFQIARRSFSVTRCCAVVYFRGCASVSTISPTPLSGLLFMFRQSRRRLFNGPDNATFCPLLRNDVHVMGYQAHMLDCLTTRVEKFHRLAQTINQVSQLAGSLGGYRFEIHTQYCSLDVCAAVSQCTRIGSRAEYDAQ